MTVRITAEDGTTNDYTVAQKNTYNWTLDYAGQQQGNVWFAQQKNGNGDWADMTAYDNTYPNWVLNTYYGVGVDAPNHSTAMSDSIHGLISAPPQTSYSTAMVFRAPKSGTVSFNVKDGEPYLRQAGNSGGTVTLSLLVNDTVKQSVTLSTSNQKAADWANFDEIELNKGDVIRVTASCNSNPSRPSVHVTPIITYVDKAVVDTEAPDAPTAVRTADVTETTAHVAWEAALDNVATTGYNVYVNGEKVNTELVTATEYDLTGLTPATDYSVEIEAVDAAGNVSEKSEAATFTTAKAVDTEAPSVPTDVKASDVTKTGATVTWTASTDNEGVAGYNVYVNGTQVNDTLVATTEYVLTGLTEGTEYTVEVEAVDTNNNVSAKAAATFTTKKDAVNPDPTVVDKTELKATTAKADAALAATDKYTAESLKALQAVYDQYASVLNDENATQAQVDEANKAIAKALNALVEKKTDDGKKDDSNKGDNTKKAAKTGDTTNVAVWAFALAASAAAAGVVVKRKKEN